MNAIHKLNAVLLLALVAALGLLAWDGDSRSPDVELVSRTGTQARTGAADSRTGRMESKTMRFMSGPFCSRSVWRNPKG